MGRVSAKELTALSRVFQYLREIFARTGKDDGEPEAESEAPAVAADYLDSKPMTPDGR
jgi:hypothetical protein